MNKSLKRIFTLIVLFLPIASQYKSIIPGLSIADLFLVLINIVIAIELMMNQYKFSINKIISNPFFWFIMYIICGSMLSIMTQYYASINDVSVRILRYIFYISNATFISSLYFDFNFFIKWYRKMVLFSVIFLFVQVIFFKYNGYILMGTIPGLEANDPRFSVEKLKSLYSYFHRPSSIFLEPGYFAQFTLPYLAYVLFSDRKISKARFAEAIFLTIGLFMTTSGQGIVLCIFVWGVWFLNKFYDVKIKKINLFFVLGLCIFIAVIPIILKIPLVERSVGRLFGSPSSSSGSRIFRGFHIYHYLEPIYKMIGIGYGNVGAHIAYNGIYTIYDTGSIQSEYMNSIAYILVNLGFIGFILMTWIFVFLWRRTDGYRRIILYVFLLLCGVSTHFISSDIIFYFPIILSHYVSEPCINSNVSNSHS